MRVGFGAIAARSGGRLLAGRLGRAVRAVESAYIFGVGSETEIKKTIPNKQTQPQPERRETEEKMKLKTKKKINKLTKPVESQSLTRTGRPRRSTCAATLTLLLLLLLVNRGNQKKGRPLQ